MMMSELVVEDWGEGSGAVEENGRGNSLGQNDSWAALLVHGRLR